MTENIEEIRRLAESGDAEAQSRLGDLHYTKEKVTEENRERVVNDNLEAYKWYRMAAEQGNAHAQYRLGIMHLYSHGFPKGFYKEDSMEEAEKWLKMAAEQGYTNAQLELGELLTLNDRKKEGERWYDMAAEHADGELLYDIGMRYWFGILLQRNYDKAFRLFERGAGYGNAGALFMLGAMYCDGRGTPKNEEKGLKLIGTAVENYTEAAEKGDIDAQCALGWIHGEGLGVPRDREKAMKWYLAAAGQGNANARFHLGEIYENGLGIPQDTEEAIKWYELAADRDFRAKESLKKLRGE